MHKNVEGVISKITSIISGENINIANLQDKSKKDMAYMIVDLDGTPTEKVVKAIRKLDSVVRVRVFD